MTDYDSTDKGIREHKDLAMALMAHRHCSLRKQFPTANVDKLLDQAIEQLEQEGMEELGVRATRYELQQALAPEIVHILSVFQHVDGKVTTMQYKHNHSHDVGSHDDDDDDDASPPPPSFERDCQTRTIVTREYQDTLVALKDASKKQRQQQQSPSKDVVRSLEFYRLKRDALQTLLTFHGWTELNNSESALSQDNEKCEDGHDNSKDDDNNDDDDNNNDDEKSDSFGYVADGAAAKKRVVDAIRNYQTQNMLRSTLIRNEIGHSVIALKSTIPGAGRGVFVDGTAMEGSLLAFIPGQVLPKEYLLDPSPQLERHLSQNDETFLLSLRSDDVLIDSRKSPYTVLDGQGSNPWAIGHIINHPPPNVVPNCRTVMINFTESMQLKATGLIRYVPNTYKRRPMLVGPKLLERENIVMHGMAIMARRDVANEELFVDYKFPTNDGENNPSWYVDATYEDWADERD